MKMKFERQHNKKERQADRDKERIIYALASRLRNGNLRESEKITTIAKLKEIV